MPIVVIIAHGNPVSISTGHLRQTGSYGDVFKRAITLVAKETIALLSPVRVLARRAACLPARHRRRASRRRRNRSIPGPHPSSRGAGAAGSGRFRKRIGGRPRAAHSSKVGTASVVEPIDGPRANGGLAAGKHIGKCSFGRQGRWLCVRQSIECCARRGRREPDACGLSTSHGPRSADPTIRPFAPGRPFRTDHRLRSTPINLRYWSRSRSISAFRLR